jgi:hypothetical protein
MSEDITRPPPSPSTKTVKKPVGGYDFTTSFYPGFARRIEVNGEVVYDQKADGPCPFVLPDGSFEPWSLSSVELGSTKGYKMTLYIDDPGHVVEQVVLRLRPGAKDDGARSVVAYQAVEGDEVVIYETPVICPPWCG